MAIEQRCKAARSSAAPVERALASMTIVAPDMSAAVLTLFSEGFGHRLRQHGA
jgi:hypothetical protein